MALTRQAALASPVQPGLTRLWIGFWQLADPKVWIASTVPILVATALAYRDLGSIHVGWLLAVLGAVYLIEIGKNAVNEAVDWESGVDQFVAPEDRNPFSGGKKTIKDGLLTVDEVRAIAWVTLILGAAGGLFIVWLREPLALWVGLAGLFAAVAYSLPPLKLAYRGLGELTVGLTFGPLLLEGAYVVQAGRFTAEGLFLGAALGLIIANFLWINEFPDYHADKRAGKMTGVVRLGRERAVWVYGALYLLAYATLLGAAAIFPKGALWIVGAVSAPKAIQSVVIAARHHSDTQRLLPANAMTIEVYQLTGLALALAALAQAVAR